ncbi:hypothetical protein L3Q82_007421 [Scortum barcoo]|uniref:Uncharacterized protein n=1 Tax=Scortum barcoo TaxID=214431 RepID=A0ACB8WTE7_9TELE|nr:hypothetical protein L3Q82_007421 [Scortum barcoo]
MRLWWRLWSPMQWSAGEGGVLSRDKKRLNRLIKRASSVCGCPLDSIEVMGERRALAKLSTIMDNTSHPLHQTVGALSSSFSNRLRHPRCRKERFPQVYEVKQSSSVVEKIICLVSKVLEPLHPHVEEHQPKNIKHLSHTFCREKQHLLLQQQAEYSRAKLLEIGESVHLRAFFKAGFYPYPYRLALPSLFLKNARFMKYLKEQNARPSTAWGDINEESAESNDRKLLYEEWANYSVFYKYQPIGLVRKYFGEKIGLYFAWLGLYTQMLIPASLVGVIVFLYGCATVDDNIQWDNAGHLPELWHTLQLQAQVEYVPKDPTELVCAGPEEPGADADAVPSFVLAQCIPHLYLLLNHSRDKMNIKQLLFIMAVAMPSGYSMEICHPKNNITMCPLCDRVCSYWKLSTACATARASHLFDNPATVFFSIFMALWAAMFMEHWKRRQMRLNYEWDLTGFEDEEDHPRAEYEFRVMQKSLNQDQKSQHKVWEGEQAGQSIASMPSSCRNC